MDDRQPLPARIFVGRQPQLGALAAALAAAQGGQPQVVVVEGEAGIGKSSLVFEFLRGRRSMPAITASGEAGESVLPYGVLRQLAVAAAAVAAGSLAGLGLLADGPAADADPLAVGVELLALISSLQGEHPVAVVVEDLQWADLPSARALLFAGRRLRADRVLLILTCRPEGMPRLGEGWARFVSGDQRVSRLTLAGLSVAELGMLCRRLGRTRLSERAIGRLARDTGGNPLLARAMLADLADDALRAPGGSLPAPRLLAGLILPRLATLSRPARDLVLAAAVLGDHSALPDAAAVAGLADPTAALDKAQRAGFLTERPATAGREVWFTHLLVRRAVYEDLGPERRQRLHRRAAAVLGGREALAHRVAASAGPDPRLAADLREAADGAAGSGRVLLAARYLEQAAQVTARGPDRDDLLLAAFELLVRAADVAAAEAVRPGIERLPASARRDAALGQLAMLEVRPSEAIALLRAAWAAGEASGEVGAGGEAALVLGQVLGMSGAVTEAEMWLDRALGSGTGREPWYDAARCIRSFAYALSGDTGRSLALFADLPDQAADVPPARTDALIYRGIARVCAGDARAATEDLPVAVHRIRAGLQVRFPGQPHGFLAEAEFRLGRWDDAQDHAELAVALARDADRDVDLAFVHSFAVSVAACRGDWPAASAHADAAEHAARIFGGLASVFAASSRGLLGFARGDPEESMRGAALALAIGSADRLGNAAALWWRPAQIWALIRTGQLAAAVTVLTPFESRAAALADPGARILAAWLRGTLAMAHDELGQADRVLSESRLAARGMAWPFHRAIIDLEHGRCLARLQRRAAAIEAVRAADDAFTALRARPFMQAAEAELTALGLRPRAGDDPGLPGLTPQELRVARLAGAGLSNREAAAQLYLSPKTVEYHLANAFAKLGIRSRHQLAALIRGEGTAAASD
jgi:DNA-binding CsgD family transcriptional regulator/tetratricopeptide (TPR) repeat protein